GTLNAERLRGVADAAVMLLEDGRDVLALEAGARLLECAASGNTDRSAVEPDVGQKVLEADAAATLKPVHDRFEQRAELHGVAGPGKRGDERQRRARDRLRRHAQLRADLTQVVIGERGDVLAPFAQRRHVDAY